jgi:phospholipase/carboxylesterase
MLDCVEHSTTADPTWSVLWLHGLGADGHDFAPIVPELVRRSWPGIRFVFPHAPVRAVTINGGARMRAWYDIRSLSALEDRADHAGVRESMAQVEALIAREHERGIALNNIVLAGFSQGGAIALAAGLRREAALAGIVGLSTYLPMAASTRAEATPAGLRTPVFMAHGSFDPVVPMAFGQHSAEAMRALGVGIDWKTYPMAHQVCAEEISDLGDWLQARFDAVA